MTLRTPQIFSQQQIEKTIPFVKRVVQDIVEIQEKIRCTNHNASIVELQQQMQELRSELSLVGCHLKNSHTGLIGFYCRYGERIVEFCWQLAEEATLYKQEIGKNTNREHTKKRFVCSL